MVHGAFRLENRLTGLQHSGHGVHTAKTPLGNAAPPHLGQYNTHH